ncbi:hypothetical protein GIB67_020703 [Kingdonia uniflora]|uniref:SNF2 N-terminal domain-containing protein n=1 Tax=Kingdonia uniflora TaxID=39325 RepID=A0A7J7NJP0_9MAGN|nr:hypothetical protein GIB67_020703 [Kingdonia uniflora]
MVNNEEDEGYLCQDCEGIWVQNTVDVQNNKDVEVNEGVQIDIARKAKHIVENLGSTNNLNPRVPKEARKLALMTMGKVWREHKVQKRKVINIEDDLEQALAKYSEDDQIDVGEVNLAVLFCPECTRRVRVMGFDISPTIYNNIQHSGVLVQSLQEEVKELREEVFMFDCVSGLTTSLDNYGCILANDMSLGKTLQFITLLYTLLRQGFDGEPLVKKAISVTSTSLVSNWESEIKNHPMLCKVLIVSYKTFRIHSSKLDKSSSCDLLMCNEARKLKNDQTLTNKNDLEEFFAMVNLLIQEFFSPANDETVYATSSDGTISSTDLECGMSFPLMNLNPDGWQEWDPKDPSKSLAVIGHYISENYNGVVLHPIDFINTSMGKRVAEVMDPNITTISPVNKLHPHDDLMATGSSRSLFIWRPNNEFELTKRKEETKLIYYGKAGKKSSRKFGGDSDDDSGNDAFSFKGKKSQSKKYDPNQVVVRSKLSSRTLV